MAFLFFAGALRTDSLNKKHARAAQKLAAEAGIAGEFIDLRDYAMPIYDGDIEAGEGVPASAKALAEKIAAADGLVISAPEYNAGISGVLKNTLDWISRVSPMPLAGKHLLLLGASPGALGAVRGLWHTRVPFEAVGMHVHPTMVGLPKAHEAFDAHGSFTDEKTAANLKATLEKFAAHATR
jgi:chromate reductase